MQREEEDKLDAMKGLENRTLESKVEMDILDALDEIKAINQRHERIDTHEVLKKLNYPSVNDNTLFTTSVSNTGIRSMSCLDVHPIRTNHSIATETHAADRFDRNLSVSRIGDLVERWLDRRG